MPRTLIRTRVRVVKCFIAGERLLPKRSRPRPVMTMELDSSHPDDMTTIDLGMPAVAQDVLQALSQAVLVLDQTKTVVYRNHAAQELFPRIRHIGDLAVLGITDKSHPDLEARLGQVLDSSRPLRIDSVRYVTDDGAKRTINLVVTPLRRDRGTEHTGWLIAVEDITARSELEKKLRGAESMASVGRLAAKVAHELNNPLDGSLRYINLCSRVLDGVGPEKVFDYLDQARQGLLRMARIVGDLLEFSRSGPGLAEEGNINRIVEEALRVMGDQAERNGVVIVARYRDDQMPALEGGKLFQVCCNIIKNAVDAMPEGGCLTVHTAAQDSEVFIQFEDTGPGLPHDSDKIFEPFFTTKPAGQGTGLGLAICRDYIEQLGGTITAEAGPEKGAIFTIRLPFGGVGFAIANNSDSCSDRTVDEGSA